MRLRLCSFARFFADATVIYRKLLKLSVSAGPRFIAASKNMAYERHVRKRKPSAIRRAWLFCFLLALPTFIFAGILLWQQQVTTAPALLLLFCLFIYLLLIAASLIEGLMRPLQTLSNVVSSLREGDYSFRAAGCKFRRCPR